ncbi:MAG TPA: bifunctional 5,10-methylenetetrahydrofolate dehydrogenase/5,10-methenyltetrahydrofolate cyclohydrolase [Chloroflexia bacterium]|nr:bifunctional 5,10-methylenetetrahydrofolate dehydrogenase/5,10-methenyltetrahydrofolate cyclohydrolase [Chloroflexia bacterium]
MTVALASEPQSETYESESALLMAGRPVANIIRKRCNEEIAALSERFSILPGLAVVRVGDDPASLHYAERITQSFSAAGLTVTVESLPPNALRAMLQAELARFSALPEIAGIIMQMPLPQQIALKDVIDVLDPEKDVDGIHPLNAGRLVLGLDSYAPATPSGGIALLDHYGIPIAGKSALVIGRSDVVGKPMAQLLLARNATVTIAHSRSRNLPQLVHEADIVACAIGKAGFIRGEWLKPDAAVLDFGASMVDGQMRGDVDFDEAVKVVGAITPVPGGTGPVTSAMLLRNTVKAIRRALRA